MTELNIPVVKNASEKLTTLSKQLGTLVVIGKVNDARTQIARDVFKSMEQTEQELIKLRNILVKKLTNESLDGIVSEAKAKAQIIIDIINRNLFERTADIGFLSTDDDIRCFLCSDEDSIKKHIPFIKQRLLDYQEKYSVYENIYIFRPDGNLVTSAHGENISTINDSFLQEVQILSGEKKYHEYYGPTSLGEENKLLYSYKITKNNEPDSEIIGVMVLSFDFKNEMKMIFDNLEYGVPGSILCLLNEDGTVLSSNHDNILQGKKYKKNLENYEIIKFSDGEYISFTTTTLGYQGFKGLPWYGHAMIPVNFAFHINNENEENTLNIHEVLNSKLVGDDLRGLIELVDKLNEDIKYMIINGHLIVSRQNSDYSNGMKPVFDEVVNISDGCKNVFSTSIGNMFHLIIKNLLNNIKSISALGIDIMDRNLYERANDVRWWALTSKLRIILAKNEFSPRDLKILNETLSYIHELYTVYDSIYIYDKQGKIITGTKLNATGKAFPIDTNILSGEGNKAFIIETLKNTRKGSQFYTVSPFEKNKGYNNKETYTYAAGINSIENEKNIGGIGIIFDASSQFHAMLSEILPKHNGEILFGSFGLFTDRNGKIISSTNDFFPIGSKIIIPENFLKIQNGNAHSEIITLEGEKYIVGSSCSKGYREYKVTDGYKNDILCLVFVKL